MATIFILGGLAADLLAAALAYGAWTHQRWFANPLPMFPASVSAALAAIVGMKAWIEALGIAFGIFAGLGVLMLAALSSYGWGRARCLQ